MGKTALSNCQSWEITPLNQTFPINLIKKPILTLTHPHQSQTPTFCHITPSLPIKLTLWLLILILILMCLALTYPLKLKHTQTTTLIHPPTTNALFIPVNPPSPAQPTPIKSQIKLTPHSWSRKNCHRVPSRRRVPSFPSQLQKQTPSTQNPRKTSKFR